MKKLTDAQKQAISSTKQSTAVVAGAGSGKTTVLIERCCNVIGDVPANLDNILAITFTEKAAAELKARLRLKLPSQEHHRLTGAWIGTFHSCCARMLRQHAPLMFLDPSFAIIDENAAKLIIRQTIKTELLDSLEKRDASAVLMVDALDFKNAVSTLEDLMDFRWHARRALIKTNSEDHVEDQLLKATTKVYQLCEEAYLEALAAQDALDFQELEIQALKLLDQHPEVLKSYRSRFKHILVDEFQDTNDVQTELVLKLYTPDTNTLCIVGDPRQSIYRFRGANVDCFASALKTIRRTDGEVVPLMHNFRSQSPIVDFVNMASDHMSEGLFGTHPDDEVLTTRAEKLIAARPDQGSNPAVIRLDIESGEGDTATRKRREEAKSIALYIKNLVKTERYHLGDIVCLFQALTNVGEYEAAFKSHDIPYRFYGGRGLLDRQEVCDLMHALRYAANPEDDIALLGLLRSPLICISDEECVKLAGPDGKNLRQTTRQHPSCNLLNMLHNMSAHQRPSEILRQTINETGYEWVLSQLDPSGGMQASVDRLICLAESLEQQAPTTTTDFISFISHLRERNARLGDPPAAGESRDAVRCMTVHTAKGLEFPVVILPDLIRQEPNSSHAWIFNRQKGVAFKLKDPLHPFGQRLPTRRYEEILGTEKYQAEAEHARLLYVAMTRARDLLVMPIHRPSKVKGRWHEWLKPLTQNGVEIIKMSGEDEGKVKSPRANLCGVIQTYDPSKAKECTRARRRNFSVSQLEAFERCPQEYYLKYSLGVPAITLLERESEKLAANIRGSIVHGVLEKLTPSNLDDLKDIISQECIAQDVFPDRTMVDELAKPLTKFAQTALFRESAKGEREVRFDWPFGEHTITGYVDWYRHTAEGIELIDFKTDQVDLPGTKLRVQEYDLQMTAYALALEHGLDSMVAATTLVFLTPGVVHSTAFDTKRRDEGMERIENVIKRIIDNDFEIGGIKPPCYKCPYHHNGMCWKDQLVSHG